ncbi:glycosyltransferase [Rhizobium sp. Root1220]|uniref:glycosyltransferase family 2 protein n=1 Tax=Rhizobium sp. Root1220 TaxID=1736432 RepID=UPI0006F4264C|nr:glycosyltransferase [Rhizobium sp. Root1220]KQV70284.1 glycosyl transferase family 2 [Rhizobium sp. Root1220]
MISVIIPHLDQAQSLRLCLSSITSQTGLEQPVEVIVVDNGSKVPPVDICSLFAGVTLLSEQVPGPGPARNRGVSQASGSILAFIDADCLAGDGWLSEIERRFSESAEVGILGGDVRIACEDRDRLTLLEAYESVFAYRMKEYIAEQGFTGTGNLAVRSDVFSKVGPFGGIDMAEDRDWGQRALRDGYRTQYCPRMIVYHPARKTLGELARKWDRHTAHDFARIQARRGWWALWMLRTAAVAVSPVAEVARIGFSDRLKGLRARALAFVGVVLVRTYRSGIMLALAFGASAPGFSRRWNRETAAMRAADKS